MKTNFNISELELKETTVAIDRVCATTKGGKNFSFRALVVVGDEKKGIVGFGIGKARETNLAVQKASNQARKNFIKVPVVNGTIPHEVLMRCNGSKILLKPACSGTGIIAGGAARRVLEASGISNVFAKSYGSNKPISLVSATFEALRSMRDAFMVARQRGVPVQKVFNG